MPRCPRCGSNLTNETESDSKSERRFVCCSCGETWNVKKRYEPLDDPLVYIPFVGIFIAQYKQMEDDDNYEDNPDEYEEEEE